MAKDLSVKIENIHLGLERIRILMDYLGNPQEKLSFVHVAGTNGKGSVSAFIASILGASIEVQIAVFAITTTIMIIFMKPLVKKFFKNKDDTKMNNNAMIGKKGIVIKEINPLEETGQVKVAGELWSAITLDNTKIQTNEIVKVTKVEGVKLVVTKDNENM